MTNPTTPEDNLPKFMCFREDNIVIVGLPRTTLLRMAQPPNSEGHHHTLLIEGTSFQMPGMLLALFGADSLDQMLSGISGLTGKSREELEMNTVQQDSEVIKALQKMGININDIVG